MKLYLAGLYTSNFNIGGRIFQRLTDREKQIRWEVENYLESYHYIYRQSFVDKIRADGKKVFLDSGAFSAFTKGVNVDIKGYCRYIEKNRDIIEEVDGVLCASVLDGIGDPLKTWQNQETMESLGVKPLPCFHYGEDERYLEHYISNYEYITLGGMVPISTPQLVHWLDRLWERYLCDPSGNPRVRVHGFGLTTVSLMLRYPWFSVDSSTWVQNAANGMIYLPETGLVNISSKSPSRKMAGQHLTTYTDPVREEVERILVELGFEPERLAEQYLSRWAFNIWAFGVLGKNHKLKTFKRHQPELF